MELPAQHLAEIVEALRRQDRPGPGKEKRRSPRVTVAAAVKVLDETAGRELTALTVDFSLGGLGLMLPFALDRGRRITVSLPRSRGEALAIRCAVTHSRELADGVWVVGVKFTGMLTVKPPLAPATEAEALRIQRKMLS